LTLIRVRPTTKGKALVSTRCIGRGSVQIVETLAHVGMAAAVKGCKDGLSRIVMELWKVRLVHYMENRLSSISRHYLGSR
jgi:hypothetical protein